MTNQVNTNICVLEVSFIENTYPGTYESISRIDDKQCLMIPSNLNELTFVYDFESGQTHNVTINNDPGINTNDLNITDATDVELDGIFWILGVKPIPGLKEFNTFLIKGSYNNDDKKITLVQVFEIPEQNKDIKFEGLTKVNDNEFVLCSKNGNFHDFKNKKYGIIYVKIDDIVMVRPLLIEINGISDFSQYYHMYKFSSIFNVEQGFALMPQFPDTYFETCYIFNYQEILRIKDESGPMGIIKSYESFNTSYSEDNNLDTSFMRNHGIEAMTKTRIRTRLGDKYYGISTWIYPYFITPADTARPEQKYVELIDRIPSNYDRSKVGKYIRPVTGKIKNI